MLRALRFLTLLVTLPWLVGCGGDEGADDPLGGLWLGDHLDFALCDGEVRAVQVQEVSCAAVKDGAPCTRNAAGSLPGAWSVEGGEVVISTGRLEITGAFYGPDRFVGSYTFLDATCCAVTGQVIVRHQSSSAGCQDLPDAVDEDAASEPDDAPVAEADDAEPDAGPDPVQTALGHVNAAREAAGAPPVTVDERIVQAAQSHADFVAKHMENFELTGMTVHDEDPDWSGFTGVKFSDRLKHFGYPFSNGWEIIAFYDDPRLSVIAWLETLYHRVPIVHPNSLQIGYGGARVGSARVDVMDFAAGYEGGADFPTVWPPDGRDDVKPSWSGLEDPRPYLPPQGEPGAADYQEFGYPSGPVVTIEFPFVHDFTADSFELTDADGVVVPAQWLGPVPAESPAPLHGWADDKHLLFTHALIPFDPLPAGAAFTAHFTGTFDGASFVKSWTFTTRTL